MALEIEIDPGSDTFEAGDDRWLTQVAGLYDELRAGGVPIREESTPAPGEKGDISMVIAALGSAGAFTAAITVIQSWLSRARDRHLSLKIKNGKDEKEIVLEANMDSATMEETHDGGHEASRRSVTVGIHRALLVANSKFYEDPTHLPELNAPIYDMTRLKKALTHPTIGVFDPGQVKLLPNARCADALLSIESFFLDCEPDDTLLLYYSGHGKLDINNNFFLCAADTRLDRLLSTAIRDEQVNAMMRSSPARSFVLVLDCCSSGGWKSATDLLPDPLRDGRFLITSSRAGQNSSDAAVVTESSPFTKYLVEAIADADVDVDDDGFVDIDEIYKYVERSLKDSGQEAQRDFDKSKGTVALARRPTRRSRGRPRTRAQPAIGPEEPPSLSVVPERIEVAGVRPDDLPVVERIYVYNRGGGVLDWTADSDDAWISLEPLDDYVRVSLAPTVAGSSRGTVYVRAPDGVVERVPVQIELEEGRKPSPSRGSGGHSSSQSGPGPRRWPWRPWPSWSWSPLRSRRTSTPPLRARSGQSGWRCAGDGPPPTEMVLRVASRADRRRGARPS